MFDLLLPRQADNTYRGQKFALWILSVIVLLRLIMGLNSIFNGYSVASSADGIPLDTYTPAAARTIVSEFALLGLSYFVLCLLSVVVLVRYRSMVPFMFALLLFDFLSRRAILHFLPIVRTGTAPGVYVNLVLAALMVLGLALSLWRRHSQASAS